MGLKVSDLLLYYRDGVSLLLEIMREKGHKLLIAVLVKEAVGCFKEAPDDLNLPYGKVKV